MIRNAILALTFGIFCSACAVQELVVAEETELVVAQSTLATDEASLLDVGIIEFAAGIPDDNRPEKTGIYEDIRLAEAKYIPYHIKTTLQGTGHWGAVRVIPTTSAFTDVIVNGAIVRSDGEYVEIEMSVHDAAGRHWFSKRYETQTGLTSYSKRRDRRRDPYQKVFNDFANDLHAYAAALPPKQRMQTRQIAELQFFADMSPVAYQGYLGEEDGIATVLRLPAENDPSVARMRQIRERDRLVVDTLNEHYANYYYGIAIPYRNWRKNARAETIKFRQEKRSAQMQALVGVVVLAGSTQIDTRSSGSRNTRNINRALQYQAFSRGINTVWGALNRNREAGLHLDAIAELSRSFGSEAAPMVVRIEGQERRLTGTAEAQYESWRKLLRDIYEAETGFSQSIEVGAETNAPEPQG